MSQERADRTTGHILIVDDNGVNRTMLSRYLAREHHTSATAENGRVALEMLQRTPFDLVLLDVEMPEMDGHELLGILRSDPKLRDIPVIMISALEELDSIVKAIELGAEDYLPKPFNPTLLRARVGTCLEQKRLRDQEMLYLDDVSRLTESALALENDEFSPDALEGVARRADSLGQLARVFCGMAVEIQERERRLRAQVHELRIEIDRAREARQVAEITDTDYFRALQEKVSELRKNAAAKPDSSSQR